MLTSAYKVMTGPNPATYHNPTGHVKSGCRQQAVQGSHTTTTCSFSFSRNWVRRTVQPLTNYLELPNTATLQSMVIHVQTDDRLNPCDGDSTAAFATIAL